jgi:YD repeat-containing protein
VTSPAGSFGYSYAIGQASRLSQISLPGGNFITNSYDGTARLLSTTLKNSGLSTLNAHQYTYNKGSQRTNQTRISQVFSNAILLSATNTVSYTYDAIGGLKTALGKEAGGTSRFNEQFGYVYDAAGNLNRRTNHTFIQSFNVNNLNQLTTVTQSGKYTVAGCLTTLATNVTVNTTNALRYADATFAATNFTLVNGTNTFTAIAKDIAGRVDTNVVRTVLLATNTYVYDQNGNLRTNGARIYEYDDENQLVRVTQTNAWKAEFTYDGKFRRRIQRDYVWLSAIGNWQLTNEVRFVYDGNVVIQHRDSNNVPALTLTRGLDLGGGLQGAGGIGGLLAMTESSGNSSYYHADGNGNVTALASVLPNGS